MPLACKIQILENIDLSPVLLSKHKYNEYS